MSLYGYGLPTTPNIDAFARKGTVFNNFYSASTFTTPSIATMLTGMYPRRAMFISYKPVCSDELREEPAARDAGRRLCHRRVLLQPIRILSVESLENEYDFLPEPIFQKGGLQYLWDATTPLHQDSGFGSRIDEYLDLEVLWNLSGPATRQSPCGSGRLRVSRHAREMLAKLPDGFFLWVHVMTPHTGHIFPISKDRGRFLPANEQRSFEEEGEPNWQPHYPPDQQSQVDRRRLLYDEFISTADRAFGSFMSELENSGKLRETTVIVSADHGESFEGGVFQHESPYQTRPVIHVPLIIRTPDQQDGRTVCFYRGPDVACAHDSRTRWSAQTGLGCTGNRSWSG